MAERKDWQTISDVLDWEEALRKAKSSPVAAANDDSPLLKQLIDEGDHVRRVIEHELDS